MGFLSIELGAEFFRDLKKVLVSAECSDLLVTMAFSCQAGSSTADGGTITL